MVIKKIISDFFLKTPMDSSISALKIKNFRLRRAKNDYMVMRLYNHPKK